MSTNHRVRFLPKARVSSVRRGKGQIHSSYATAAAADCRKPRGTSGPLDMIVQAERHGELNRRGKATKKGTPLFQGHPPSTTLLASAINANEPIVRVSPPS